MKLRIAIADDEPLARERLRQLLDREPDVEISAECADGPATVSAVRENHPDLLLLDVQMPGLDGFGVLNALGSAEQPLVVFVTAFDQHAIRAFEIRALDYLLKPIAPQRLRETLGRARERLAHRSSATPGDDPSGRVRRLAVRQGERIVFINTDEIDWIEAASNYALIHVGRQTHILRETMAALEAQLPGDLFLRVSRSAILNLRRVRELQTVTPTQHAAVLHDGQRVTVSRSVREFEQRMRLRG